MTQATRWMYAGTYTLAVWTWTLGLVGVATALRVRESPRWRYLADASYWMYLVHIPLVWGLQLWMMKWPLSWMVKYPLIPAITVTVLLLTYRYLVRGTFVGVLLNGRGLPHLARAHGSSPVHL